MASPPCSITVPAPIGQNVSFKVDDYAATTGTGTPLGIGTPAATFIAQENTVVPVTLEGVMSSYTLVVPPELTSQITGSQSFAVAPLDASGAAITGSYVTNTEQQAVFTFTLTATDGTSTSAGTWPSTELPGGFAYSGILPNPSKLTSSITGYPNASVPIPVASATGTVGYALQASGPSSSSRDMPTYVFAPGSSTIVREYNQFGHILAFDPSGTLWLENENGPIILGVTANGSRVGPITNLALSEYSPMLGFDRSGELYAANQDGSTINIYSIGPTYAATLVRTISPAGGGCGAAAADPSKNVYVGCKSGVLEFSPGSGNGDIAPVASNANASGASVDAAGNLYAQYCSGNNTPCVIGIWPSGSFGSGAPPSSLPEPQAGEGDFAPTLSAFAVDPAGNVYEQTFTEPSFGVTTLWFIAKGTTTPDELGNVDYEYSLAVPLR